MIIFSNLSNFTLNKKNKVDKKPSKMHNKRHYKSGYLELNNCKIQNKAQCSEIKQSSIV